MVGVTLRETLELSGNLGGGGLTKLADRGVELLRRSRDVAVGVINRHVGVEALVERDDVGPLAVVDRTGGSLDNALVLGSLRSHGFFSFKSVVTDNQTVGAKRHYAIKIFELYLQSFKSWVLS